MVIKAISGAKVDSHTNSNGGEGRKSLEKALSLTCMWHVCISQFFEHEGRDVMSVHTLLMWSELSIK